MAFTSNTYTATLDIKRRTPHRPLIIEGDAGVQLDLTLADDGAAMDITGLYARCVFRRSDGRTVLVSESDDPCPMTVTKAVGRIVIDVPRTCFRDGDNFLQVQILDGDPDSGTCLSSTFPLLLRAYNCLLTNEAVEESVEFPILEWLIDALRNMDVSITMVSPTTSADASLTLTDGAYHLALTIPKGAKIVDIDVVEGLQSYSMIFTLDDGSIVSCAIPNWVTAEWVAAQNFVDSDGLASELLTYATKQYVTHAIANSGHYTKPSGGIPSTDMTSAVQASLALADSAYQMPNTGIPKSDLDYLVQVALERANNPAEMTGATASADGTAGIVPAPEAGDQGKYLKGNGTWAAIPVFTGAGDSRGAAGLVPPPEIADVDKFLKGDGTWASAGGGTSYTPLVVTYTLSGITSGSSATCDRTFAEINAALQAKTPLEIYYVYNGVVITIDISTLLYEIEGTPVLIHESAFTFRNGESYVGVIMHFYGNENSITFGIIGVSPANNNPQMDGNASPGSSPDYSRGDHVHPTDTSRLATDGNAKDVTIKSTSTTPFTVIPNTAITFETLVNILAGWYYAINLKQDELTAGTGISISNNVISATGGGGSEKVIFISTSDGFDDVKRAYDAGMTCILRTSTVDYVLTYYKYIEGAISQAWFSAEVDGEIKQYHIVNSNNTDTWTASSVTVPVTKYTTLTLATSDWSSSANGYSCSKTVTGMTATSIVWLSYSDTETEITESQSANTLTFTVEDLPSAAITVNVSFVEGVSV